jgi:IMP dehydrogenase
VLKKTLQLSFDDVWIEPQYSEVDSRRTPDLSSRLSQFCTLSHPVIASNMASVVGEKMAKILDKSGSIAIHHRFLTKDDVLKLAQRFTGNVFSYSIGIKDEDLDCAKAVYAILGNQAVPLVDIAHGHSKNMGKFVEKVKMIGYETLIAGNIATGDGFNFLADHGADAVRVGIAGGKVCTTKYITGHHIPTLQSVFECNEARLHSTANHDISIIADGGISSSGDAVKALAAGADFVCLGSVLAATSDSPGELSEVDGAMFKTHFGMSSKWALHKFYGEEKRHVVPEGKSERLPFTGDTTEVLEDFIAGIRSAFAYSGAKSMSEFHQKAILRHK